MLESLAGVIASQKFPSVLLMFGEEEFLLEEAYTSLLEAALGRDASENPMLAFNLDVFDGADLTPDALVERASAFPMMSDRRVVVVKHFEKVNVGRPPSAKTPLKPNVKHASKKESPQKTAESSSPLVRYLLNPAPTTLLILIANIPELAGLRAAITNPKQQDKALKKLKNAKFPYNLLLSNSSNDSTDKAASSAATTAKIEWIEFPKLYERELPSWVAKRFQSYNRDITPDACSLLVARSGESLRDLHNEIQKILTFVQDKPKITHDDIVNVIGSSKTYNVFELQKAIGQGNLATALEIVQRMLAADRQELLIITMLTRYFIILWKLSEAVTITRNQMELGKVVDVSSYFIPEYLATLERYSASAIEQALSALCDADITIKTSAEPPDVALQRLIIRIITASGTAS
jgi:DNA polymerase-3 subunit delta